MPHPPQLLLSQLVSMQEPLQYIPPCGQGLLHDPWMQYGVDWGQTFPQAPQLFGSEFTGVHVPLQTIAPATHP